MATLVTLAAVIADLAIGGRPDPPRLRAAATTLDGAWRFHTGDDPRWAGADWDDSGWPAMHWGHVSSGDRIVWLRAHVDGARLSTRRPLEVAVSAVGAYEVFWNGTRVGGSGQPGSSRAAEVPGPMITTSLVPDAPGFAGSRRPGRARSE